MNYETNNTDEISIFIPTKNRNPFLTRLIKYYSNKSFIGKLIIFDASDGKDLKKNKQLLSRKYTFSTDHIIENKRPMISLNSHLDLINTRFATVCNDDDILTFEGLNKSSELLKKNNSFSACWGTGLKVKTKNDDPFENITKQKNKKSNFEYNDKIEFLYEIARAGGYDIIFCLQDKNNFQKIIKFALQFDCEIFQSLAMNFMTALTANFKLIKELYLIRQNHSSRDITSLRADPYTWFTQKNFSNDLKKFIELFTIEIKNKENLSLDQSEIIIKNALNFLLINRLESKRFSTNKSKLLSIFKKPKNEVYNFSKETFSSLK